MSRVEEVARDAWGAEIPDWVIALARACDTAGSQAQVARRLNVSGGQVSQVLRKRYPGKLDRIEEAVSGAYMGREITCPALGPIPSDECLGWRRAADGPMPNPTLKVRMFRACNRCPVKAAEARAESEA